MKIEACALQGLWVVKAQGTSDDRGMFARVYCQQAFAEAGIRFAPVQMSVSFNRAAGTLRGMHWQADPWQET